MNIKQLVMRNYSLILTNISIFLTTNKRLISIGKIIYSIGHLRQRGAKTFFYYEQLKEKVRYFILKKLCNIDSNMEYLDDSYF